MRKKKRQFVKDTHKTISAKRMRDAHIKSDYIYSQGASSSLFIHAYILTIYSLYIYAYNTYSRRSDQRHYFPSFSIVIASSAAAAHAVDVRARTSTGIYNIMQHIICATTYARAINTRGRTCVSYRVNYHYFYYVVLLCERVHKNVEIIKHTHATITATITHDAALLPAIYLLI